MANPWFRMYVDFLNDPKMIALAFEDQRHFIGILALKSDGTLDNNAAPELMNRIVAQRLWIDHGVILEVKKRLVNAGLIDADWQPIAWGRRQFVSDSDPSNAERQRRYRERNKHEALRNVTVTPLDTDTDTDTEQKIKPLRRKSAPMPSDFALNETSEAYAQARNLQVTAELASFKNWHTAKGSSFKDWQAAWRTWCDKAVEFGRSKTVVPAFGKQANRDSYAAQAAQAAAKLNIGERNERTDERDITEYCSRVA